MSLTATPVDKSDGLADDANASSQKDSKTLVHEFVDELNALVNQAGLENIAKDQMLVLLQLLLRKYPGLHQSNFRQELISLIQTECEANCSIHLNAEELDALWIETIS